MTDGWGVGVWYWALFSPAPADVAHSGGTSLMDRQSVKGNVSRAAGIGHGPAPPAPSLPP